MDLHRQTDAWNAHCPIDGPPDDLRQRLRRVAIASDFAIDTLVRQLTCWLCR